MRFRLLSQNLITLLEQTLTNDRLLKLLYYPNSRALLSPEITNKSGMMFDKIFPSPFTGEVPIQQATELRVFMPSGKLRNRVVLGSTIVFQIVIHDDLWNIVAEDGTTKQLRPFEIMAELVDIFEDKSIGKLGVINFTNYFYKQTNKDYGVYNLEAQVVSI